MSYRAHKTVDQLRAERHRCESQIAVMEKGIEAREKQIAQLQQEIADKRTGIWKRGQIIGSCNLWIARKETGQCT